MSDSKSGPPEIDVGYVASLARLELRIMFEELNRRLPDLELATEEKLPVRPSNFITGVESMPVRFSPSAPEGWKTN